jgi:hypothetical protein
LAARAAQAHHLGHQKLTCIFLPGLGSEVEWFCSPTAMEMDGGKLDDGETAWVNLGDGAGVPGGASALRMAPMAAAMTGGPPPCRKSARDATEKRGDGGNSALFLRWGKTR